MMTHAQAGECLRRTFGTQFFKYFAFSDPSWDYRKYDVSNAVKDANLRDYFRLFMMPGVLHCGSGPGPDTVDWPSIIVDWVENGKAPDHIIARKAGAGGVVTRSRPLCPYPQHAVYDGKGPADAAESFTCR